MSNTPNSPHQAAMYDAYQATLDQFSRSPSPAPQFGEKAGLEPGSSPLKVTTEQHDLTYSPLAEIPAYQPTKAGGDRIEQVELMVITKPEKQEITSIAPALLSPAIDPALMQPIAPRQDISPVVQGKRPMPPAMHRLNTNFSNGDSSVPSSVTSSPETPLGGLHFGMYANSQGQDSFEDLSRVPSRSDLITRTGTNTSASSEDGVVNGDQNQGGVPAPKAKKSHARKQPQDHIKRARNAFILFRKHITDSGLIPATVESKHQNISVVAAKMWREAPQDVRHKFQEEARLEKEEHQRKYPNYRYQPVFRRTDIIRRRVRKDKTEDEKVEAVAEAMIKGKAGEELVEEVKEQIIASAAASEDESDGGNGPKRSRRRREDGELSKGALRAQRAQNRAKAMRQNLLGSSLLGGMMYQQNYQHGGHPMDHRIPIQSMPQHPGAQYHVAHHPSEYAMPVGYDVDGRPVMRSYHSGGYDAPLQHPHPHEPMHHHENMHPHEGMHEGMYRLPPIQDAVGQGMWESHDMAQYPPPRMDHWPEDPYGQQAHQAQWTPEDEGAHQSGYFEGAEHYPDYDQQYRFPPMLEGSSTMPPGSAAPSVDMPLQDPNAEAWKEAGPSHAPDAPSGHVFFNERLFDGALGSAPMAGRSHEDEGLGAFHEAVAQANETPEW